MVVAAAAAAADDEVGILEDDPRSAEEEEDDDDEMSMGVEGMMPEIAPPGVMGGIIEEEGPKTAPGVDGIMTPPGV
jgi:hypothetical protein